MYPFVGTNPKFSGSWQSSELASDPRTEGALWGSPLSEVVVDRTVAPQRCLYPYPQTCKYMTFMVKRVSEEVSELKTLIERD